MVDNLVDKREEGKMLGRNHMETRRAVDLFIASARSRNLKADTIKFYLAALDPLAEMYKALPLEPEPIESFVGSLKGGPETHYARFNALRIFYRFLEDRYEILNPMRKLRPPKRPRIMIPSLSDEDIAKVLHATKKLRDYALIRLFLDNGIRLSEARMLDQDDVHNEEIIVRGKTGEESVPISPDVRDLLRQLGPGPVFKANGHNRLSRIGIECIVRRRLIEAGVSTKKKGPHIFRHTFARIFLMNGGGEIALQRILRHASLTMTEKYVHLWGSDIRSVHRKFSPSRQITVKPPGERRDVGRPRKKV